MSKLVDFGLKLKKFKFAYLRTKRRKVGKYFFECKFSLCINKTCLCRSKTNLYIKKKAMTFSGDRLKSSIGISHLR